MISLQSIKPAEKAVTTRKRIGRGQGSGRGGTSTRGHNGAQSRSGYSRKRGFEGGQMPLQKRIPKFGFKNNNKIYYKPINLDAVIKLCENKKITEITPKTFLENGLAGKKDLIKILARGKISTKIDVTAHKFSNAAKNMIEKAGGTVTFIEQ